MFVLDTNILAAALISRNGASHLLVSRAISQEINIAVSVALALEYESVLKRPEIISKGWATDVELDVVLDALLAVAHLIQPIYVKQRPVLKDPGDDMVLECALEGQAQAIITTNVKDFSEVSARFGIEILKPGELVARLRKKAT